MVQRIKGVTVTTVLDGRGVDVVFRSPYRWRIYEGDREVSKDFGFIGGRVVEDEAQRAAFHAKVEAGEIQCRLQTA